ncbi:MAG: peptidylprolyl isomerase [Candidatus Micrarchaeaceae archaeon]|jgi:FKBP-type peptidyl-prolyl cis-trans isomerase 2|nr:peptidylprolyl isomerase [Candidatus Micrarchaeota archaeon]HII10167.1 peptidylprolyl isomerase [Candidatus Micrarchaeota archaeon]
MKVKKLYILIAVVLVAAVLGVAYFALGRAPVPVVGTGDTIEVYYTGTLTNGTQFGSNFGGQPLQFTVGANQVIEGFDQGVIGMKLNETKNLTVPVNEAYGPVKPGLIIMVPLSAFKNNMATVGMTIDDNTTNGMVQGIVTAVNSTAATVNFNPPLAGKTLMFQVKVVGIQKAAT